jgi:hypothetical protein
LNIEIQAEESDANDPPPVGLVNLSYHLQRVWGSVQNILYYSAGPDTINGDGDQSWPPLNQFVFPFVIKRLWPTINGLVVFTSSATWIIQGQGTSSSPFFDVPFTGGAGFGLFDYNTFAITGASAAALSSDFKMVYFDPQAGIVDVGLPIADQLSAFQYAVPGQTYVVWHAGGSTDTAVYLSSWESPQYRLNTTSAPESGTAWSVPAGLNPGGPTVIGVTALASVQTAPGQRKLIYGPGYNVSVPLGPITYRDSAQGPDGGYTVTTDNGLPYDAFATVGSITLAQPGQRAEIAFFETDCPATGTSPTMTVWLDEVSTWLNGGTGTTLAYNVVDPPELQPGSQSILQKRAYLNQGQVPEFCRHFQLKFDWGTANSPDELLSFTVWGTVEQSN